MSQREVWETPWWLGVPSTLLSPSAASLCGWRRARRLFLGNRGVLPCAESSPRVGSAVRAWWIALQRIFLQGSLGPYTSLPPIHLTASFNLRALLRLICKTWANLEPDQNNRLTQFFFFLRLIWSILCVVNTCLLLHCWPCPIWL